MHNTTGSIQRDPNTNNIVCAANRIAGYGMIRPELQVWFSWFNQYGQFISTAPFPDGDPTVNGQWERSKEYSPVQFPTPSSEIISDQLVFALPQHPDAASYTMRFVFRDRSVPSNSKFLAWVSGQY
jgi:hypothetical protein